MLDEDSGENDSEKPEVAPALKAGQFGRIAFFLANFGAAAADGVERIKDGEERDHGNEPRFPAMLRHPPERDTFKIAEQKRRAERGESAADVADDENEKRGVERTVAATIKPHPGPQEQNRGAGGADDIGKQATAEKKKRIGRRFGAAAHADVDAAREDKDRTDEHNETDVIARLMQQSLRLPQDECVVGHGNSSEHDGNKMIMPFPMMLQNEGQQRDAKQHRHKGQQHERVRLDD